MLEDLTYSSLHEMMMKKFKFESNSQINLSLKLSSFDCNVDITDDAEYSQQSEVKKGKIFDNKEDLMLAVRHAAKALAAKNEFPLACHAVCCRHLMMNLSLKNQKRKGLFWKICKAYTREEFATSMSKLQMLQPDAYQKLCDAGLQRWSRAHCPLVRYNYMTSNSVESVNAKSVIHRKEPMLKLAKTYRAMVQEWYYKRRQLAENMTYEITDWAAHKVAKNELTNMNM
nr:transposase, MuDR, MULE transposase domain protein [Tanacetum cinerariifolium]